MNECCKDHAGKPKKKYATYEEAEAVARQRRREGVEVHIYKCFDGDGFHLTSHGYGDGIETENRQRVMRFSKSRQRNTNIKLGKLVDSDTLNELLSLRNSLRKKPHNRY